MPPTSKSNPVYAKRAKRRNSAIITGLIILTLLAVGGILGYTQVIQKQTLLSQAAAAVEGEACSKILVGSTSIGAQGTGGCTPNQKPELICTEKKTLETPKGLLPKVKYSYSWLRKGCVTINAPSQGSAPTCNSASGRPIDCPCVDDTSCASKKCVTTSSSGRKKCVAAATAPTLGGTKPAAGGSQPGSGGSTTPPAAGGNPGSGGSPGNTAAAPAPYTDTSCKVVLYAAEADAQGKAVRKTNAQGQQIILTAPKAGDVAALSCEIGNGPPDGIFWAFYRIDMTLNGGKGAYKTIAQGEYMYGEKPETPIQLQSGDQFECTPHVIPARSTITDEQRKCVVKIP